MQGRDLVSCMYFDVFSLERKAGTFKNQNTGNTVNPSQTLGSHNPTALTHNNCHFYLSNIACHYFCVHYVLMSILHKNLGKWDWGGLTVSPVFWFLNVPAFFSRENTHRCRYVSRFSKGQPCPQPIKKLDKSNGPYFEKTNRLNDIPSDTGKMCE